MYDIKALRMELYTLINSAMRDFPGVPVSYALNKSSADRYIVFGLQDMVSWDERNSIELEINAIGPASDEDGTEAMSNVLIRELDREVVIADNIAFYIYRSTRNRVDGSDPHTVRYRMTFDLYLYER